MKALVTATVKRWGGSITVIIPTSIVKILELKPNDIVIVNIEKVKKDEKSRGNY